MRGLKPKDMNVEIIPKEVASFTDAWIETRTLDYGRCIIVGRILYGCVD